jgi:hypothetical protein
MTLNVAETKLRRLRAARGAVAPLPRENRKVRLARRRPHSASCAHPVTAAVLTGVRVMRRRAGGGGGGGVGGCGCTAGKQPAGESRLFVWVFHFIQYRDGVSDPECSPMRRELPRLPSTPTPRGACALPTLHTPPPPPPPPHRWHAPWTAVRRRQPPRAITSTPPPPTPPSLPTVIPLLIPLLTPLLTPLPRTPLLTPLLTPLPRTPLHREPPPTRRDPTPVSSPPLLLPVSSPPLESLVCGRGRRRRAPRDTVRRLPPPSAAPPRPRSEQAAPGWARSAEWLRTMRLPTLLPTRRLRAPPRDPVAHRPTALAGHQPTHTPQTGAISDPLVCM